MDYTLSPDYATHAGTGNRMHEENAAVTTVWSEKDANSVIWSLMEVIKAGGLAGVQFDEAVPATYQKLLTALRSAGVFTTPPQFDASTKAATMAAVQRAIGSNAGRVSLSAATLLDASHVGKLIVLGGGAGFAVTLPPLSTVEDGAAIEFLNVQPSGCTIQRSGVDLLQDGLGTFTSYAGVKSGDGVRFVADKGGGIWQAPSGVLTLRQAFGASGPFPSSLAGNGYITLPNGLIVQWGRISTATTGTVVTFPITFPSAVYAIIAGASGVGIPANSFVAVENSNTSTFNISSSASTPVANWVALGR